MPALESVLILIPESQGGVHHGLSPACGDDMVLFHPMSANVGYT